ncbi:MAG: thioredoxin domain-containing protein, partial [bacterium]
MFKKIISSPKLFLTLAFLSLLIVFSAFFYAKTQMAGAKAAYWQFKLQRLINPSAKYQTADPLITQANSPDKQPTQPTAGPNDSKRGQDQAKVVIFEFSDFTCAYCAAVQPILKQVEATYKNQVQIIWRDFPLTTAHPEALKASRAAQCARLQTKPGDQFWAYHDLLFANQGQLNYDNYLIWAKQLGLDKDIFVDCLA